MVANVAHVLAAMAARDPARLALVVRDNEPRGEWSYGALHDRARSVAAELRPGSRVAVATGSGPDFVHAWFGAIYAGATVVPIPRGSTPAEIAVRVAHSRCEAIVVDAAHAAAARHALTTVTHAVRVLDVSDATGAALERPRTPAPTSPAMILYTSGTTGRPKGVVISHAALTLHTAALVHHTLRLDARSVVLGALPLTHSYGCRMVMLAAFYAGARAVLVPRFSAHATLRAVVDEGVTWIPAVPTMFAAWGAQPPIDAPALSWCLSAGAPLPSAVRAAAERVLGATVREGYGMTEATFSTIDAPPNQAGHGSVGRPVWGVEIRIVDPGGRDVAIGCDGEVYIRGQNQMDGYLDDPVGTAAACDDGWVRSGDVGHLDDDGRLTIVDRLKDVVLRGGFTVYPSEVEEVLSHCPGVAQAAVVGRPDAFYGEEVVAVLVATAPGLDVAAVGRFLVARLSAHKIPTSLAFVDELPLGPSRKVLKRELRARVVSGSLATVALDVAGLLSSAQ